MATYTNRKKDRQRTIALKQARRLSNGLKMIQPYPDTYNTKNSATGGKEWQIRTFG